MSTSINHPTDHNEQDPATTPTSGEPDYGALVAAHVRLRDLEDGGPNVQRAAVRLLRILRADPALAATFDRLAADGAWAVITAAVDAHPVHARIIECLPWCTTAPADHQLEDADALSSGTLHWAEAVGDDDLELTVEARRFPPWDGRAGRHRAHRYSRAGAGLAARRRAPARRRVRGGRRLAGCAVGPQGRPGLGRRGARAAGAERQEHPRLTSLDQLTCPTWCTADHLKDMQQAEFVCNVLHAGMELAAAPFGNGDLLASAELMAGGDDAGEPDPGAMYFAPDGIAANGYEASRSELRERAAVLRYQAVQIEAYADRVKHLVAPEIVREGR